MSKNGCPASFKKGNAKEGQAWKCAKKKDKHRSAQKRSQRLSYTGNGINIKVHQRQDKWRSALDTWQFCMLIKNRTKEKCTENKHR